MSPVDLPFIAPPEERLARLESRIEGLRRACHRASVSHAKSRHLLRDLQLLSARYLGLRARYGGGRVL